MNGSPTSFANEPATECDATLTGEDTLCAAQLFFDPTSVLLRNLPAARVWIAVLIDALTCAAGRGLPVKSRPHLQAEAIEWLTSTDESEGSFRWIINVLYGDPDRAQQNVHHLIESGKLPRRAPKSPHGKHYARDN